LRVPAIPPNENERLQELLSFNVLDTIEQTDFDALTRLASQICGTPIALISLIDPNRQWFKSHHGLAARETPREYAFCAHAINSPDSLLVVPDSRADDRFADNPLVTGDPHVIFYAGCPLVSTNGFALGTLCVIDHSPRELNEEQLQSLRDLARQVVNLMELGKVNRRLRSALAETERSNSEANAFFNLSPSLLAIASTEGQLLRVNPASLSALGHNEEELLRRPFLDIVHPDDLGSTVTAISALAEGNELLGFRNRFSRADGTYVTLEWHARAVDGIIHAIARDVTSMEIAERELLRTNQFLEMAGHMAKVGYWEINLEDTTLFWSNVTRQIHEVPEDFIPVMEQGINFYREGHSRELITEVVGRSLSAGEPYDVELELVTARGNIKWVRAIGNTEFKDGRCIRAFGTFQDIDEQKRAGLLREQFITEAPVAIAMLDKDMRYIAASQKWVDDYSLNRQTLKGRSHYEIFPEIGEDWKQIHRECLNGAVRSHDEDAFLRADGTTTWLRWKVQPWYRAESEVGGLIMYTEDITSAMETREQLRRSEEQFRGSFEYAAIGMAQVGTAGQWLRVNESLCRMVGYTREELSGLTFQDLTHPDDLNTDLSMLRELSAGQRESYGMAKRYLHKDGHIVHALLTVSAVRDSTGRPLHYISQITDITGLKTAENRLRETLNRTEAQNRRLENFAHIVSHNLRSHYANIAMLVDLLQADSMTEDGKEVLGFLKQANDNLGDTITDLNDVAVIGLTEQENLLPCNLFRAAEKALQNVSAEAMVNNVSLSLNVPVDLMVLAIPAYLESILQNLLSNAVRYCSPNRAPWVIMTAKRVKNKVRITVSDNGVGIDLKTHGPKLFGMYRTFHGHRDSRGLGLFITKNQVEAMLGRISLKSTPDVGTTFIVTLKSLNP
jgi:PAS domain S-box-containing protein